jgi:recombination protein RecA
MANQALAVLQSALRARQLDRTLTSELPSLERSDPAALVPSDVVALDACLRGGLPRGQLSELSGPQSSGRMTLLLQFMAAATRRGELAALIDTCDRLDVSSVVAAGVDLERLLWIRGSDTMMRNAVRSAVTSVSDRVVDRALKALNLVLQAGGFGVVAIDLAEVPPPVVKRLPFTTWLRVQRTIEGSDTACVLVTPEPLARSAGGVTLSLWGRPAWIGTADRSRRLTGLDVDVRVVSPRRRMDGGVAIQATLTN